jgi:preprotein translocase subunit SecG
MKKKIFGLLFFLIIFLLGNPSQAATTNQEENKANQEVKIEELQKEIDELKGKKDKEVSKEDLYKALLEREKDIASSLYNFTTIFVAVIALMVAVGSILFGIYANKLRKHQKRIDLVIDSKQLDDKIAEMEKKVEELRFSQRLEKKEEAIQRFNETKRIVNVRIRYIREQLINPIYSSFNLKSIADEHEFEGYLAPAVIELITEFEKKKTKELSAFDDQEDYVNLEDELINDCFELEGYLKELTILESAITSKITNSFNK